MNPIKVKEYLTILSESIFPRYATNEVCGLDEGNHAFLSRTDGALGACRAMTARAFVKATAREFCRP